MDHASPPVTICIPAWNAEEFIDRTLQCARNQTFENIVIRVSIDLSDDATEEICRAHAAEDDRIEVVVQPERLGWAGNANELLDMVNTDYAFLYFHDDEIDPRYTEVLLNALGSQPDALSAHCDYEAHGRRSVFEPAHTFRGRDAHRILNLLVGPEIGTGLRSMIRRSALESGLRFPIIGVDGPWRAWPFLLRLVALGPAVGVHELLYRRWLREDGMTVKWRPTIEELVQGQQEQAALSLAIIDSADATETEKQLLRYGLYLNMMTEVTRQIEIRHRQPTLLDPGRISGVFAGIQMPESVLSLEREPASWIYHRYAELLYLEARHARLLDDSAEASAKLELALQLDPRHAHAMAELARISSDRGDVRAVTLARRATAIDSSLVDSVREGITSDLP